MLQRLLPIRSSAARSGSFIHAALIPVKISGREVADAINTTPIHNPSGPV